MADHPPASWPEVGAFTDATGRFVIRLWAPFARRAHLVLEPDHRMELEPTAGGYFETSLPEAPDSGTRYWFQLDDGPLVPDPASRWQPDGVFGPSAIWRPEEYGWSDSDWQGVAPEDLVVYELHVGTFTDEGTLDAAAERLPALRELGVTAVELMPVAQFSGSRNWGYDGVFPYAVHNTYGGPQALQRFVDACHRLGLGVILDVVYNHFGPEGCVLGQYGPYTTRRYPTPWGDAVNYDGPYSDAVRAFVLHNARYWIRHFHVDGLRIDAVHAIYDSSPRHILAELATVARQEAQSLGRSVLIVSESDLNDPRTLDPPEQRGYGHDMEWSNDFHHCIHALLTGERAGYYADFGNLEQLVKCLNQNYVYDGIYSRYRKRRHGAPSGEQPGHRFICFIQNHDQVGNRPCGERLASLVSPAACRLAACLLLLSPFSPLLFMGEEYGEERPFPFFCDFQDSALGEAVRRGRQEGFRAFGWSATGLDPCALETFRSAVLSWDWRAPQRQGLRRLYQDLLTARRRWPPMADRVHRHANLLRESRNVVRLIRGDQLPGPGTALCYFNVSPETVPLGDERSRRGMKLLFTSEHERYTGVPTAVRADELRPFECRVYGSPAWWCPLSEG